MMISTLCDIVQQQWWAYGFQASQKKEGPWAWPNLDAISSSGVISDLHLSHTEEVSTKFINGVHLKYVQQQTGLSSCLIYILQEKQEEETSALGGGTIMRTIMTSDTWCS